MLKLEMNAEEGRSTSNAASLRTGSWFHTELWTVVTAYRDATEHRTWKSVTFSCNTTACRFREESVGWGLGPRLGPVGLMWSN